MNKEELLFSGTLVAYYIICPRKVWLFAKGIRMEHTSEYVQIGKLIDEESFKRSKSKGFADENVSIDFYVSKDGIVVHEVKASKALEEAHKLQVKYYIYYLRKLGVNAVSGVIHYPKARKLVSVKYSEDDEMLIENALKGVSKILEREVPPPVEKKPYCRKCSYYEFCYG